jgi:hypothetical protein
MKYLFSNYFAIAWDIKFHFFRRFFLRKMVASSPSGLGAVFITSHSILLLLMILIAKRENHDLAQKALHHHHKLN